jgi:HAE1 family hydrophobic/amphiphilic exporter-1
VRIWTWAFAALLGALANPAAAAVGDAHAMTLAEAIERALRNDEELVVEREGLVSAEAAMSGSRGAYDPLLEVETSWQRSTEPVDSAFSGAPEGKLAPTDTALGTDVTVRQRLRTGAQLSLRLSTARGTTDGTFTLLTPAYDTAVGVELRQPLLRGRRLDAARLGVRVATVERSRAAASLSHQVSETVAAVERAYWALVAAREEVAVREESVRLAETHLENTRLRIEEGAAPETEMAQPRAEIERRRGELLAARETVSKVESSLKLLVLGDADSWSRPIDPTDRAEVGAYDVDVDAVMTRALASRPDLTAAAALEQRRELEVRFAREELKPALDAVVSYTRFGLTGEVNPDGSAIPGLPDGVPPELEGGLGSSYGSLLDGDHDDTRIGLILSLPIGNRAARAGVAVATSEQRRAAADLARARKAVRAEVLDAVAAMRTAAQRFEAARAERESAEVQLGAELERLAAGLSTSFLVLTRQNDLSRARLAEIASRTDFRVARMEMARTTSSLLEEHGIDVAGLRGAEDACREGEDGAHG